MSKTATIRKGDRVQDTVWGGSHVGTAVGFGRDYGLPMVHVQWDRRCADYETSWPYDLIPEEFVQILARPKTPKGYVCLKCSGESKARHGLYCQKG